MVWTLTMLWYTSNAINSIHSKSLKAAAEAGKQSSKLCSVGLFSNTSWCCQQPNCPAVRPPNSGVQYNNSADMRKNTGCWLCSFATNPQSKAMYSCMAACGNTLSHDILYKKIWMTYYPLNINTLAGKKIGKMSKQNTISSYISSKMNQRLSQ